MPRQNLVLIFLVGVVSFACYRKAPQSRDARTIADAIRIITDNYVEPVDRRQLFANAMQGMVRPLDQYSEFIDADSYRPFKQSLDQEFGGIGILIEGPPKLERLTVISPVYDTPAHRAGIRAGDVILAVDGTNTDDVTMDRAVSMMRGVQGSSVTLTVRHPGEANPVDLNIRREIIKTPSVLGDTRRPDGSWNFFLEENPRIGLLRLTTFGEHSLEELRGVLRFSDHPVDALIFDLRGNAGGLLKAAVETCDLFLDHGTIVTTRGRGGKIAKDFGADPASTVVPGDMPVVVLVNRYSASASEIVAACLKDHQRAIIVGERTWGKGSVQEIIELEGGESALKLTTASYWRPNGKNIHRRDNKEYDANDPDDWGVRPSEGFAVTMSDEDAAKVFERRRERDVIRFNGNGQVEGPAGKTGADSGQTVDDPQMRKAIEYLEEQLRRADAKAQKA